MLGHGHSACANITVNIDPALRHGIGHTVGRIAMHNNFSSGIQPTNIIGSRTKHFDNRIGKSHRTQALAGSTQHIDFNLFFAGFPQTSTDTVLAIGRYFNLPIPGFHGFLNTLFHDPRFNTDVIFQSVNFNRISFGHVASLFHDLQHILDIETPGCIRVTNAERIRHTDRQRRGTSQRSDNFL